MADVKAISDSVSKFKEEMEAKLKETYTELTSQHAQIRIRTKQINDLLLDL